MRLLYSVGVWVYYLGALVMSMWDAKARKWIRGRHGWEDRLAGAFSESDSVIWFHCASLGEFEQGRPVIEEARRRYPKKKILLTFFSPSGYEKRKDYKEVDFVSYLPLDTRRNARRFLELVSVEKAVFIKYEFWYYFLNTMSKGAVPLYLASGKFRKSQLFFKWYGGWYRKVLQSFDHLFVQDVDSESLLKLNGISRVSVAGDTRFDRVAEIAKKAKEIIAVERFVGEDRVLIVGSSWEKDEVIIKALYEEKRGMKWIIAPHEPTEGNVERLKLWFPSHVLFSDLGLGNDKDADVLIVNTIGHLSSLYRYGTIAYIGGGFGRGIHNVLEASVSGLPVLFGPRYKEFREAVGLVELGGAFCVTNEVEAEQKLSELLGDLELFDQVSSISKQYTRDRCGATQKIAEQIFI